MKNCGYNTPHRCEYVNIADKVEVLVRLSGVRNGLCLVNGRHITVSVYINDAESGLIVDYDDWLEKKVLHEPISKYCHNNMGEDNTDTHLKR